MSGHKVARNLVKNASLFDKYQCPHCNLLLKNAVQSVCGHWLCENCAATVLDSNSPKCPRPECQEDLKNSQDESDREYFPDRFVRREIGGMVLSCPNRSKGCNWEDTLAKLEAHLKTCDYSSEECPQCGTILTLEQMESHKLTCPKAIVKCPLSEFGCSHTHTMTREELEQHVRDCASEHLQIITDAMKKNSPIRTYGSSSATNDFDKIDSTTGKHLSLTRGADFIERDGPKEPCQLQQYHTKCRAVIGSSSDRGISLTSGLGRCLPDDDRLNAAALNATAGKLKGELESRLTAELHRRDEEIGILKNTITKMEKSMRSKNAEFEDRDFRLSLIENSNHNGTIIWKIPQFSQRMSDAQTGKYTSIFSLPFYTGRYGYKMCLRLYILGDGIGKNSHMSLFFVVMKGEFDNILQWPFAHKVTFKLINQTGGRDIIDTFQPDPMSSSFHKPKSDMNIASGCPRFVSHTELKSGGFIVDDTVFIKCSVDCNKIKHP